MTENPANDTGEHQDPSEQYQMDKAVETSDQPVAPSGDDPETPDVNESPSEPVEVSPQVPVQRDYLGREKTWKQKEETDSES